MVIVEPDNYVSLKDAFNSILDNKEFYLNLGKRNCEIIKSSYSWDKRSELILKKLTKLTWNKWELYFFF